MNQEIGNVTGRYKSATSEIDRLSTAIRDLQHSILEKDKQISKMVNKGLVLFIS